MLEKTEEAVMLKMMMVQGRHDGDGPLLLLLKGEKTVITELLRLFPDMLTDNDVLSGQSIVKTRLSRTNSSIKKNNK